MKKNFMKFVRTAALTLGVFAFVMSSCADYDDDINNLQTQIDANKATIAPVQGQFDALDKSVEALSSLLTEKGTARDNSIADLKTGVTTLEGDVATLETGLADVNTAVDGVKEGVTALEGNVAGLEGKVTALEAGVTTLEAGVTTLNGQITDLTTNLADLEVKNATLDSSLVAYKVYVGENYVTGAALDVTLDNYALATDLATQIAVIEGLKMDIAAADSAITAQAAANVVTIAGINSTIATLATKAELASAVSTLEGKLTGLSTTIGGVDGKVTTLRAEFEAFKTASKTIFDGQDMEAVKKTIMEWAGESFKLEMAKFLNVENFGTTEWTEFEAAFAKLFANAVTNSTIVLDADLVPLQEDIVDLETKVTALEAAVKALQDAVNTYLQSIVFIPESYLGGVEAEKTMGLVYNEWGMKKKDTPVTATGETWNAPISRPMVDFWISPTITVEYKLNPSSVTADQITKVQLVANDDKVFVSKSAASAWNPTVVDYSVENGVLSVQFTVNSLQIQEVDDKLISTFQLNVTAKGSNDVARVISSDHSAIYKDIWKNMTLVLTGESLYATTSERVNMPLYGADRSKAGEKGIAYTAIGNIADVLLPVNETLDLKTLVKVKYDVHEDKGTEKLVSSAYLTEAMLAKYNMKLKYTLSNYFIGANETVQNEYGVIDANNVLSARLYDESGIPIPTAVGRKPMVRVELIDTENGKVVNVGWIKTEITHIATTPQMWEKDFGVINLVCDATHTATSKETAIAINQYLGLDKEEFDRLYPTMKPMYNHPSYTGSEAAYNLGTVTEKINDDTGDGSTTVLKWVITEQEMLNAKWMANSSATEVVMTHDVIYIPADVKNYPTLTVRLTTTVKYPTVALSGTKIPEMWFNNLSTVRFNTEVSSQTIPTKADITKFAKDIDLVFVGGAPAFSFTNGSVEFKKNMVYKYQFTSDNERPAKGVSGADYSLKVSDDATQVLQEDNVIAEIDQSTGIVTYKANYPAKDILNANGGEESFKTYVNILASRNGVPAHSAWNQVVGGSAFTVQFLRPVNIADGKITTIKDGSQVEMPVLDLMKLQEWYQSLDFVYKNGLNPGTYGYYQVKSIKLNVAKITTDLGGEAGKLLTDVTSGIIISQTPTNGSGMGSNFFGDYYTGKYGKITYVNNQVNISESYVLTLPFEITYYWGTIVEYVDLTVTPTDLSK